MRKLVNLFDDHQEGYIVAGGRRVGRTRKALVALGVDLKVIEVIDHVHVKIEPNNLEIPDMTGFIGKSDEKADELCAFDKYARDGKVEKEKRAKQKNN